MSVPRTASVYAEVFCELCILRREVYESIIERYPESARQVANYINDKLNAAADAGGGAHNDSAAQAIGDQTLRVMSMPDDGEQGGQENSSSSSSSGSDSEATGRRGSRSSRDDRAPRRSSAAELEQDAAAIMAMVRDRPDEQKKTTAQPAKERKNSEKAAVRVLNSKSVSEVRARAGGGIAHDIPTSD